MAKAHTTTSSRVHVKTTATRGMKIDAVGKAHANDAKANDAKAKGVKAKGAVDTATSKMQQPAGENAPEALQKFAADPRVCVRHGGAARAGKCVVYWMQRSQRGIDNHAVNIAVAVANELKLPVVAYFAGIANFPHANLRHYAFLQQGLQDIEADLAQRGIGFVMRRAPHESHERFFADVDAAFVVGDENPMREPERWRERIADHCATMLHAPFWTVDADVVVPSRLIDKAQYGAYTIRPRLLRALPEFLVPYENPRAVVPWRKPKELKVDSLTEDITRGWKSLDRSVKPVAFWHGGTHAAQARLKHFVTHLLRDYGSERNKPDTDGTSCMSPYLHYGHLSSQSIALAVKAAVEADNTLAEARTSYFNELIVWRELAVNLCLYRKDYDAVSCAENWARATIAEHDKDEREHLYTLDQLDRGETYDELWNAAQMQMVRHGWMHNYMRMYWAKKIVEWTPDAATALKYCIHMNDRYFLDGRDPNGYAGAAWAILGKFDRAWGSRPVFGKRRYMSGASTARKFNTKSYITQVRALPE
jgi:deoxyribodipyrimidine photo-lyase